VEEAVRFRSLRCKEGGKGDEAGEVSHAQDSSDQETMTAYLGDPGYSHTQKAPLSLILCAFALACFGLAWLVSETPGVLISGGVGLLIALLASAFHHMTVEDQGDLLAIRFGPVPLFHRTLLYADIERVEVGRTLILEGWGIHLSIRGGWVWNLWGRNCVVVHLRRGSALRIGTDDAENLAGFLKNRTIGGTP
jgi:hypothetical protein